MVRPMLPKAERRSEPIYVLLRPNEKRILEAVARRKKLSRGAVLRQLFLGEYCRRKK